jgi:hypothetical protein
MSSVPYRKRRAEFRRLGFGEGALAEEVAAAVVGAADDLFSRRPNALTKGTGDELANRVSGGVASWAKPEGAYLERWIAISSKSSPPKIAAFAGGKKIQVRHAERPPATTLRIPASD